MFRRIKKGFTLVELIIAMIIVSVLAFIVFKNLKDTDESRITSIAATITNYGKIVNIHNVSQTKYYELKDKLKSVDDGDEDMLDEMVKLGIVGIFQTNIFKEPDTVKAEIREITFDGYKKYIYLYLDATNEYDKYLINEAIKKNSPLDEDYELIQ